MNNSILTPLLTAIDAENDEAAEAAIIMLSSQGTKPLPALLDLNRSPNDDHRWWSVRGLAALAAEDGETREIAIPALMEALTDDDDATRCVAALALGQLQAVCAVPVLVLLLADRSGWVRTAGADALALLGEVAVPALGEALHDQRDGVRVRAAYALNKIRSIKAARWLFPALNDPNHIVHTYVYEALDGMGLLNTILVQ